MNVGEHFSQFKWAAANFSEPLRTFLADFPS